MFTTLIRRHWEKSYMKNISSDSIWLPGYNYNWLPPHLNWTQNNTCNLHGLNHNGLNHFLPWQIIHVDLHRVNGLECQEVIARFPIGSAFSREGCDCKQTYPAGRAHHSPVGRAASAGLTGGGQRAPPSFPLYLEPSLGQVERVGGWHRHTAGALVFNIYILLYSFSKYI